MSNATHTPGPWSVSDYSKYHVQKPNSSLLCSTGVGNSSGHSDRLEDYANARLIAAAPELLEHAVDLIDILSDFEGDYTDPAFLEALELLAEETRAAIAKAKGGAA